MPKESSPIFVAVSIFCLLLTILLLFAVDRELAQEDNIDIVAELSDVEYRERLQRTRQEYEIWVLEERVQHHEWNLRSTKFIFWLSMLISIVGVSFAFWQFAAASTYDNKLRETDEVEIGNEIAKLQFRTRSLATLVLLVSLIYLFIYVRFLYPIDYLPFSEGQVDQAIRQTPVAAERTGIQAEPTQNRFTGADQ